MLKQQFKNVLNVNLILKRLALRVIMDDDTH